MRAKGDEMSEYGADYLRRLREAVEKFEEAFDAWMATQVESNHLAARGVMPTVWTKDDQDEAVVRRLELDVAESGGSAARGIAVTGAYSGGKGLGLHEPVCT